MLMIASFTGRGIDEHEIGDGRERWARDLLSNLTDGVRTGRVRWFLVVGAGVPDPRVYGFGEDEAINTYNALRADGAHEEASAVDNERRCQ